jgi:hypothetical protein
MLIAGQSHHRCHVAHPAARRGHRRAQFDGGAMTFALSPEQIEIREAVARLCARFGDDYWLE